MTIPIEPSMFWAILMLFALGAGPWTAAMVLIGYRLGYHKSKQAEEAQLHEMMQLMAEPREPGSGVSESVDDPHSSEQGPDPLSGLKDSPEQEPGVYASL